MAKGRSAWHLWPVSPSLKAKLEFHNSGWACRFRNVEKPHENEQSESEQSVPSSLPTCWLLSQVLALALVTNPNDQNPYVKNSKPLNQNPTFLHKNILRTAIKFRPTPQAKVPRMSIHYVRVLHTQLNDSSNTTLFWKPSSQVAPELLACIYKLLFPKSAQTYAYLDARRTLPGCSHTTLCFFSTLNNPILTLASLCTKCRLQSTKGFADLYHIKSSQSFKDIFVKPSYEAVKICEPCSFSLALTHTCFW